MKIRRLEDGRFEVEHTDEGAMVPITAPQFQFSLVNLVPSRPVACRAAYKKKPRCGRGLKFFRGRSE
jgi:hypothetical protein